MAVVAICFVGSSGSPIINAKVLSKMLLSSVDLVRPIIGTQSKLLMETLRVWRKIVGFNDGFCRKCSCSNRSWQKDQQPYTEVKAK